jgi:2'-hydroxyisoflavone reductase
VKKSRRDFVKLSAAFGGSLGMAMKYDLSAATAISTRSEKIADQGTVRPLRILILGGTGFIGPHQVRYAVSRGHKVSVFNRGRRQADLPESVEHLLGDRNDNLESLKGREWDVIVDNPTTLPKWVRDSASLLKNAAKQYIFISTISVYADFSRPGMDETSALLKYEGKDAMTETEPKLELYGPLKALSEREAEKWFPGRTTIVRPGLIVGPGDATDRFTYWPVRIDRGGEILAPGTPSDPVQFIDARDLAEWVIRAAEEETLGIYNATGPRSPLSIAEMLYGIRAINSGSKEIRFTWANAGFLLEQKVRGWSDMPVWASQYPESTGFCRMSNERAVTRGLTFRPLAVTARDTLEWFKTLPAERQAKMLAGLTEAREKAVLAAWHEKAIHS